MAILVALLTIVSTLAGGAVALRAPRDRMHLILGLSAGLLLGLVAFDLLPEVFALTEVEVVGVPAVMIAFVGAFLLLHMLERAAGVHDPADSDYGEHHHEHRTVGFIGALALIGHSFLDGLAIGLAFQIDSATGWIVAIAVLAHDFADGLNTVTLLLKSGHDRARARRMLIADALAPVLGAIVGTLITVSDDVLGIYLAAFAGLLVYLATSHILPEAHASHPSRLTLVSTLVGVLIMFGVVALAH